jgi:hypothetical protein
MRRAVLTFSAICLAEIGLGLALLLLALASISISFPSSLLSTTLLCWHSGYQLSDQTILPAQCTVDNRDTLNIVQCAFLCWLEMEHKPPIVPPHLQFIVDVEHGNFDHHESIPHANYYNKLLTK